MAGRISDFAAIAYHGGALDVARRLAPDAARPWIDLSTGVNPHAYPLPDLEPEVWTRLPASEALAELEAAAACRYGVTPEIVVAGPGTQALIQTLARIFSRGVAGVLGPTYGGHEEAFAAAGARVATKTGLEDLSDRKVAIVVNPNNPDGRIVRRDDLLDLHARLRLRGGLLIVDEAFADFDGLESLAPVLPAGAIVLRSFGKTFGLPGLRTRFRPRIARHQRSAARGAGALAGQRAGDRSRSPGAEGSRLDGRNDRAAGGRSGSARCAVGASWLADRRWNKALPSRSAPGRGGSLRAPAGGGHSDAPLRRRARPPAFRHSRHGSRLGAARDEAARVIEKLSTGRLVFPFGRRDENSMPIRNPRVFTIPLGAPFLPTLARALMDGELIPGFPGAGGPLALASTTIYVPTQRAASALAEALLAASGGESVLLPRIAPLGAFEPDDAARFFEPADEQALRARLPPAVGELMRRHTLAVLVRAWGQALRGAIRGADAGGLVFDRAEPALVASTPAQAYALAGDLAALIDDMIIEGVDWRRIETLAPDAYDSYWRITLDFLKIAFTHWPQWLNENGLVDRAKRVALSIDVEITRLEAGASGPTIIAGSTGANRATAELIAAIARSEKGAVVLPGLDKNLDERAWAMIGSGEASAKSLAGHPQALLSRLVRRIGVARAGVRTLGAPSPPLAARAAFLSEALRPAEFDRQLARAGCGACAVSRRRRPRRGLDRRRGHRY